MHQQIVSAIGVISMMFLLVGCTGAASSPASTTQPGNASVTVTQDDPEAAKSLERDLQALYQSRTEGMISNAEYQQLVAHAIASVVDPYVQHPGMPYQSLGDQRFHTEVAYLGEMKKRGELTAEQYESARRLFADVLLMANGVSTDAPHPPQSTFAKKLEEQLLILKASYEEGVLTPKQYAQSIDNAMRTELTPITLDQLKLELHDLTDLKKRGVISTQRYDQLCETLRGRYIQPGAFFLPEEVPTTQPDRSTH